MAPQKQQTGTAIACRRHHFTAAAALGMQGNLVDAISKSAADAAAICQLCHRLASSPAARKEEVVQSIEQNAAALVEDGGGGGTRS